MRFKENNTTSPQKTYTKKASSTHTDVEIKNHKPFTLMVQQHFGNSILQSSIEGSYDVFGELLHTFAVMDSIGMNMMENLPNFLGNTGIQGQISRKQIRGGSQGETLPDEDDHRLRSIGSSTGSPLPTKLREQLEQAFSHSFSHVRIHNQTKDADAALALNAQAFTMRSHIYFAAGKFEPQTHWTHVVLLS